MNIPKKAYKEKEKRNNLKKAQAVLDLNNVTPKLSQSLVKELYKYKLKEECGLRVEAKYVTKSVDFPSSEAQELGNYFEFKATGQLPRDGHTPEPILLKTGKPSIDYQRMDAQVENFKRIMKRLNFSVEQTGFTFTNPKYSGIADIIAHDNNIKTKVANKKRIIIDLKTSGLLHDKWSEYGWADESIEEKDGLMIQAIHYKLLAKYEWGIEDIPFYFIIFSSKNDWEYKIFKVKNMEDKRSKGARCDQAGKSETINLLNTIIGEPKYTSENTKKRNKIEFCIIQEMYMRYFDKINKNNKQLFL